VTQSTDKYFGFQRSYEDLAQAGVIDPTKVAHTAAVNASSIASPSDDEGPHRRDAGRKGGWVQHPT
jgi:hypothetical protein